MMNANGMSSPITKSYVCFDFLSPLISEVTRARCNTTLSDTLEALTNLCLGTFL